MTAPTPRPSPPVRDRRWDDPRADRGGAYRADRRRPSCGAAGSDEGGRSQHRPGHRGHRRRMERGTTHRSIRLPRPDSVRRLLHSLRPHRAQRPTGPAGTPRREQPMSAPTLLPRPAWLPRERWPFPTEALATAVGQIAVTDVGEGPTLLFVHI